MTTYHDWKLNLVHECSYVVCDINLLKIALACIMTCIMIDFSSAKIDYLAKTIIAVNQLRLYSLEIIRYDLKICFNLPVGNLHLTPASSEWAQLCVPIGWEWQSMSLLSLPMQTTSSSQIWPVPKPKWASLTASTPKK